MERPPGDGAPPGWREGAGTAAAFAAADAGSWPLGLCGFLARGGVVVLVAPILSVPSPVLLSMLFRGEVGMIGRGDLRLLAILVGVVLSIVAIAGVIVSAYADVALAERFVRHPESSDLCRGHAPAGLSRVARRSAMWWVASIQAVALLPVIGAVSLLVEGTVRATTDELLSPSTTALPLTARVLGAIAPEMLLASVVLVLAEMLTSLASRHVVLDAWGLLPGGPTGGSETRVALRGTLRLFRAPARVAVTAAAGWLAIGAAAGFAAGVTFLAWGTLRDLLAGPGMSSAGVVSAALLVCLFAAVWVAGLGLVGFAATLRSCLWTADALR